MGQGMGGRWLSPRGRDTLTFLLFPKAAWKGCLWGRNSCWMSLRQAILNTSGLFSITSLGQPGPRARKGAKEGW